MHSPRPKISFVTIVLNGMPFVEYSLRAIYPFAHEIIIIEGAVEQCRFAAGPDGSSIDGTVECIKNFPDPRGIIKLEQGVWPEKVDMQNRALEICTGDYVWLVDSDEVYKEKDLATVSQILIQNPWVTQINFICHNFWKGFDYTFESPDFLEEDGHYRRLFKFVSGAQFTSHRPPTLYHPGSSLSTEEQQCINGSATNNMGIRIYHYSYVLDSQVMQKVKLYESYGCEKVWQMNMTDWYENVFQRWTPENREEVESYWGPWTGDRDSYSVPFSGKHPEVMYDCISQISSGDIEEQPKKLKIAGEEATEADLTQIDTSSKFAQEIRKLFEKYKPSKVIETGTYLGSGTTKVISETLRDLNIQDAQFYSIEINPNHVAQAQVNLAHAGLLDRVQILHGLSVPRHLLPTMEEIEEKTVKNVAYGGIFVDHSEKERALAYWKETDFAGLPDDMLGKAMQAMAGAPDFILLDSGGHMGKVEFDYVISQLKKPCFIALDDIYHIKHHENYLALQKDERFTIVATSDEKFGFCIAAFKPQPHETEIVELEQNQGEVSLDGMQTLLWIRDDSIGDCVLSSGALAAIKKRYPRLNITVLCQNKLVGMYEASGVISNVIGFDRERCEANTEELAQLIIQLRAHNFDVVINSVYSRTMISNIVATECGAKRSIAIEGDDANIHAEDHRQLLSRYTDVVSASDPLSSELERHKTLISALGCAEEDYVPVVWLSSEDIGYADGLFAKHGLDPDKTIVLAAGAQYEVRHYSGYGQALAKYCNELGYSIIALDALSAQAQVEENIRPLTGKVLNLCGKTSIRQAAAIMHKSSLTVSAETAAAHISAAVGTPHVVLLGGGHFGRFMPYSPLSSVVCLPLKCYGCGWHCTQSRPLCVQDVSPELIDRAIREALESSSPSTRIYLQGRSYVTHDETKNVWGLETFNKLLTEKNFTLIPCNHNVRESGSPVQIQK